MKGTLAVTWWLQWPFFNAFSIYLNVKPQHADETEDVRLWLGASFNFVPTVFNCWKNTHPSGPLAAVFLFSICCIFINRRNSVLHLRSMLKFALCQGFADMHSRFSCFFPCWNAAFIEVQWIFLNTKPKLNRFLINVYSLWRKHYFESSLLTCAWRVEDGNVIRLVTQVHWQGRHMWSGENFKLP